MGPWHCACSPLRSVSLNGEHDAPSAAAPWSLASLGFAWQLREQSCSNPLAPQVSHPQLGRVTALYVCAWPSAHGASLRLEALDSSGGAQPSDSILCRLLPRCSCHSLRSTVELSTLSLPSPWRSNADSRPPGTTGSPSSSAFVLCAGTGGWIPGSVGDTGPHMGPLATCRRLPNADPNEQAD